MGIIYIFQRKGGRRRICVSEKGRSFSINNFKTAQFVCNGCKDRRTPSFPFKMWNVILFPFQGIGHENLNNFGKIFYTHDFISNEFP